MVGASAPPSLAYTADERTANVWTDAAVEQLSRLEFSCSLDAADSGRERYATEIGAIIGTSKQWAQRTLDDAIKARRKAFDDLNKDDEL